MCYYGTMSSGTPLPKSILQRIARLTAEGLDPEQIRSQTDLDVSFIRKVQALDEFSEALREENPAAHDLWQEAMAQQHAKRRVKAAAREDAPEHYEMLKDLVRTSRELRDTEKARILENLLKFSGAVDEHVEEETVYLSPTQLAILQETQVELAEDTRVDSQADGYK